MRLTREEVEERLERLKRALKEKGLDAVLIAHFVNLYYFSGSAQMGFLIVTQGDPEHLVIRDHRRASEESFWRVERIKSLRELISRIKGRFKRLGIEGSKIPFNLVNLILKSTSCELFDVTKEIRGIRAVKSVYEISMLREACRIEDRVFERAKEVIREGMTELELDGELRRVSRILGHQGILRMHGWNQEMIQSHVYSGPNGSYISYLDAPITGPGVTPAVPQGCSGRILKKGEPIVVDFGVGYNGYIADQTRTFSIGKLPDKFLRAFDVAIKIKKDMEGFVRDGVNAREVFERACSIAEEEEFLEHFMGYGDTRVKFVGHGVGLEIDELPVLAQGFNMTLKENMVFAFEPKFVFPGEGAVGVESVYLVRKDGVEKLPRTEDVIFQL